MSLSDTRTVVLGTSAFTFFWLLAVFPSCIILPVGRTAGALGGAVLTVVSQVLSPDDAYSAVDLSILGLLFGTMVVGVFLERADMFKYLANVLSWKSRGGKDLMCRICMMSAISSALFTNDTSCVVLTEFVLKVCRQKSLHPKPFLIALATSANIGSVATPIGNPQNLIIAVQSGIPFGKFVIGLLPSMLLGVLVNTALLLLVYWKQLSVVEDPDLGGLLALSIYGKTRPVHSPYMTIKTSAQSPAREKEQNVFGSHANGPATTPREITLNVSDRFVFEDVACSTKCATFDIANDASRDAPPTLQRQKPSFLALNGEEKESSFQKWKRRVWKCAVYIITAAMLASLLYGLDLTWSAITAAVSLMALDFQDAAPNLEKVSYSLLVFFAGMFITVEGFNTTGIPGAFWDVTEPHARIDSMSGVIILSLVVIVLSNLASNVPTVLLLGSRVALSTATSGGNVTRAWLIMAWTSTVGGNLTLVGSAANLIVSEQAAKAQFLGYDLTFWNHLVFGFPSTLLIAAIGLTSIRG